MVVGGVYSRPVIFGVEKKPQKDSSSRCSSSGWNPVRPVAQTNCPVCGSLMGVYLELRRCNNCGRIERAKESC
jgi:hypothetical protein